MKHTYFFIRSFAAGAIAIIVICVVAACRVDSASTSVIEDPSNSFRPDGGYELLSPSENFKEVIWLSVITGTGVGRGSACAPKPCVPETVEQSDEWIPYPPKGILVTKTGLYEWEAVEIRRDRFAFATDERDGVKYQFVGSFSIDGDYERVKPTGIVLTGQLAKVDTQGKTSNEEVTLTWFSWGEVDRESFRRKKP